jgi:tRNA-dihydrouridine synthase
MLGRIAIKKPWILFNLNQVLYPDLKRDLIVPEDLIPKLQTYFEHHNSLGTHKRKITKQWHGLFNHLKGAKKWRENLANGMAPQEAYEKIFI